MHTTRPAGGHRVRARCRERLDMLAQGAADPRELIASAAEELRHAIGFDGWCWLGADPDSALPVSHAPAQDLPFADELPTLIAQMSRGSARAPHARLTWTPGNATSLAAVAGGVLERSELWRESLGPHGVGDGVMVRCADEHGTWGQLNAHRLSEDRQFDRDALELLGDASAGLGRILRLMAARAANSPTPGGERAPAVVTLDAQMNPRSWTRGAREWLEAFPDGAIAREWQQLPSGVYAAAARVRVAGQGYGRARGRIYTTDGSWAVVDAQPLEGSDSGRSAVTIRPATADEVLGLLCRAHALSGREAALTKYIVDGLSTRQIAARLSITQYTVKDHLKSIFKKVKVATRGELASRLTGRGVCEQIHSSP